MDAGATRCNVLVVGIGGQGVMTAAEAIARAALASGLDASKTEVSGMSQRGGIVSSQVRIGRSIMASEFRAGEADLLIALELAEGLRWSHWLARGGAAYVNTFRAVPPIVASGAAAYPDDPLGAAAQAGAEVHAVDADAMARTLGDRRLSNTIMLGAACPRLPFAVEALEQTLLARFPHDHPMRTLNARAFEAGRTLERHGAVARTGTQATGI
ncbi:MAG: indolepyruvate oxidoreductase subunit beta [Burkholderiales bacterium]|nr:indolepyruvate oxidoreductase subunit beta [Burkholderiales bacterium]